MKVYIYTLIIATLLLIVNAGWTTYCTERGSCPDTLIDVAVVGNGDVFCICGGYSSSTSEDRALGVYCAPTSKPETLQRLKHINTVGMQVSIAASKQGTITTGGIGFLNYTSNLLYSIDLQTVQSSTFFGAIGQDVKPVVTPEQRTKDTALFAFVGTLDLNTNEEGLLFSDSSGKDYFKVPGPDNVRSLRYGAYPKPDYTIVTSGYWPESSTLGAETEDIANKCLRLSRNVCLKAPQLSELEIIKFNSRVYLQQRRHKSLHTTTSGYHGAISITKDLGKTWVTTFETDEFYFNDISCVNEQICMTVAEADKEAFVYTTQDGGLTWKKTLTLKSSLMVSLMRVRALSPNEAYVSGGMWDDEKCALVGLIYKSIDGGMTWNLDTSIPDVGIVVGLSASYDSNTIVAVGPTQDQRTIVAVYHRD